MAIPKAATQTARQAVRRWLLTGSIAAITVTGAFYGAGLKTKQEIKEKRKTIVEADPEEQIAYLEKARNELVTKRNELERKIAAVAARRTAKEEQQNQAK